MAPEPDERGRIGGALIELCFERGYSAASSAALVGRAGLDANAFHRHFADLEDCFLKTLEAEVGRFRREASALDLGGDWRQRTRVGAYASYRFLAADRRLARFFLVEARAAGERPRLFVDGILEDLAAQVDRGRAEMAAGGSVGPTTAAALVGGVFNQLYGIVGRRAPLPPEGVIVPQLMYAIVLPYLGPAVAREELTMPPPRSSPDARPVAGEVPGAVL